jgi:putative membrane protein
MSEASEQDRPTLRLHPWSWLFAAFGFIRQLIVPLLAVVVFGARNDGVQWLVLLLVPIVLLAVWQQRVFRYGFSERGLVIHEGLVFKTIRHIDYDRIENIDSQRSPLHRMLGVTQLRVETSTGGRPEAEFRVLGHAAAEHVRQRVAAAGTRVRALDDASAAGEPSPGTPLLHLPAGELVRQGLIDNRGLIVVAALFGMLHQSGVTRAMQQTIERWLEGLAANALAALDPIAQLLLVIALLVFLLLAVRGLSIVFALINYHGFTLTQHNGEFRVRYGMLTRVALTIRIARIQAAHQAETLLHRWFRRVSLRVDLAGGLEAAGEGAGERTHWLAPICTPDAAAMLMRRALPDVDFDCEPDWQGLAPRAAMRLFKRSATIWSLAALVPAIWLFGRWGLVAPVFALAWAAVHARLYVRHTRWSLTDDAVLFRSGWLNRRLIVAPRDRVQAAVWLQSPFDRRYRMAALSVDTAGVHRGQSIRIRYLPSQVAAELARALYCSRQQPLGNL